MRSAFAFITLSLAMLAIAFAETTSEKQQRILENIDHVLCDMTTLSGTMENPLRVPSNTEIALDSPKEVIRHPIMGDAVISMSSTESSDTEPTPAPGILDYIRGFFW